MDAAAAIVLAGGRSTRMGMAKAALDWHGSTLLRRVTGILARSVDGPVVVVRAAGQELPELPPGVEVVTDAREGRGPLEGLAAGLRALAGRAQIAYLSSTDVPLLHPAFVRAVISTLGDADDVALPEIAGHHQPLAAAYRPRILDALEDLLAADELRPASLYARCRVRRVAAEELLRDPTVALLDPRLDSLRNLNDRSEYQRAHAADGPQVAVEWRGGPTARSETVRGWSLVEVADAAGTILDSRVVVRLNGVCVPDDPQLPLVAGDAVAFG